MLQSSGYEKSLYVFEICMMYSPIIAWQVFVTFLGWLSDPFNGSVTSK